MERWRVWQPANGSVTKGLEFRHSYNHDLSKRATPPAQRLSDIHTLTSHACTAMKSNCSSEDGFAYCQHFQLGRRWCDYFSHSCRTVSTPCVNNILASPIIPSPQRRIVLSRSFKQTRLKCINCSFHCGRTPIYNLTSVGWFIKQLAHIKFIGRCAGEAKILPQ